MELIFEIVVEILLQFVFEFVLEVGGSALAEPFREHRRRHPLVAALGSLLLGALVGLISLLILPRRILGAAGIPGLSLIVSPIANGLVLEGVGRAANARGWRRPYLATFWPAAFFAFGMALVRFIGR